MNTTLRTILLIFILSAFAGLINAQTQAVLQLSHKKKATTKYLKEGRSLRVITEDNKYRGRIDSIAPGIIYVKGQTIEVKKIENVRYKMRGTQIGGAILGTGGLVISGLGIALIVEGAKDDSFGGVIVALVGVAVTAISTAPVAVGTSMFFMGKSHKSKKWEYKTAELAE